MVDLYLLIFLITILIFHSYQDLCLCIVFARVCSRIWFVRKKILLVNIVWFLNYFFLRKSKFYLFSHSPSFINSIFLFFCRCILSMILPFFHLTRIDTLIHKLLVAPLIFLYSMLSYHVLCDIRTVAIIFVLIFGKEIVCAYLLKYFLCQLSNYFFFLKNSYESCDVLKKFWKEMSLVLMFLKTNFEFNVKQSRKKICATSFFVSFVTKYLLHLSNYSNLPSPSFYFLEQP